jgi:hypothetical protein
MYGEIPQTVLSTHRILCIAITIIHWVKGSEYQHLFPSSPYLLSVSMGIDVLIPLLPIIPSELITATVIDAK